MLRSMYAGVSGMGAHMDKMDVIGNNIANVNTTGFKSSRATFQTMLSQTMQGGSAPQDGRGGTNPRQVGLGVTLGSVDRNMGQGNLESTGKNTDLAIEGDGFFVLNDGGGNYYSRAGNTDFDRDGYMVNTSNGYKVQGWTADAQGRINTNNDTGDIRLRQSMDAEATDSISFDGNLSSDNHEWSTSFTVEEGGHEADVNITYERTGETIGEGDEAREIWDYSITGIDGGRITGGSRAGRNGQVAVNVDGEDSEITAILPNGVDEDLDETNLNEGLIDGDGDDVLPEITPDGADGGVNLSEEIDNWPGGDEDFRSSSFRVSDQAFDSQGNKHDVAVDFQRIPGENSWQYTTYFNGNEIDQQGPIEFDTSGNVTSGALDVLSVDSGDFGLEGVDDLNIQLDFDEMTQFAGAHSADVDMVTGYEAGALESYNIDGTGTVTGNFDNGMQLNLARVATATFNNPGGLSEEGNNLFLESNNSGTASIGAPGAGGRGAITAGTLEMSNVDMAREFTDMITTQRGFQGNSRTITTADEILQEVVNMKR